jgi:hypothetical protein
VSNISVCPAEPIRWQRQPYSISLMLPPLSVLILKPETETPVIPQEDVAIPSAETDIISEQETRIGVEEETGLLPEEPDMFEEGIPREAIAIIPEGAISTLLAQEMSMAEGAEIPEVPQPEGENKVKPEFVPGNPSVDEAERLERWQKSSANPQISIQSKR